MNEIKMKGYNLINNNSKNNILLWKLVTSVDLN